MSSWHSEEKSWKYFTFIIETMLSFDLLLFYTNTILCALLHKTGVNHFPPAVRSYWRMSNQSCQITKKCISRVKYPICYYIHVNFKICDSHIKINYTKNSKEISSTDKIFNFGSCDCSDFFCPHFKCNHLFLCSFYFNFKTLFPVSFSSTRASDSNGLLREGIFSVSREAAIPVENNM